jgi:hypothetical protein
VEKARHAETRKRGEEEHLRQSRHQPPRVVLTQHFHHVLHPNTSLVPSMTKLHSYDGPLSGPALPTMQRHSQCSLTTVGLTHGAYRHLMSEKLDIEDTVELKSDDRRGRAHLVKAFSEGKVQRV